MNEAVVSVFVWAMVTRRKKRVLVYEVDWIVPLQNVVDETVTSLVWTVVRIGSEPVEVEMLLLAPDVSMSS